MEPKLDIFDKFEIQLMSLTESNKMQIKRIHELEVQLKEAMADRQSAQQMYASEVEKNRLLDESVMKLQFESKIAIEKQSMEASEQKKMTDLQVTRLTDQLTALKQKYSHLQQKCSHLEHQLSQKENQLNQQNAFRATIGSEMSHIQKKTESIRKYLQSVDKTHSELIALVKLANDSNSELKQLLTERSDQLSAVQTDNASLRQQWSDWRARTSTARVGLISDNELQALRFNQQIDSQKQELLELRRLLTDAITENENLTKKLSQNVLNSLHLNNEITSQTSPSQSTKTLETIQ